MDARAAAAVSAVVPRAVLALLAIGAVCASLPRPAGAAAAEQALRAAWVGRWVVLRTAVFSNCDARYTNNRVQGAAAASRGDHRFTAGELGRVDNLHLQRARVDLLVELDEPLRVELRDGPFRLFRHLRCRVELELPAPRDAVRQGNFPLLKAIVGAAAEPHDSRDAAAGSQAWNARRVEPLPEDHEERLAAYLAWQQQQLALALRDRLAEALDRAAALAPRSGDSVSYTQGLLLGVRDFDRDRHVSTSCEELAGRRFSPRGKRAPEELDGREAGDWEAGYKDGQRLLFEISLAQRLERCLPAPG